MSRVWSITQDALAREVPLHNRPSHAAWTVHGSEQSYGLQSLTTSLRPTGVSSGNHTPPAIPDLSTMYPKSTLELAAKSEMHEVYLIPTLTLRRTMWTYSIYFRPPDSQVQHLDHRSESPSRHPMDRAIRRPPPNPLPIKVQRDRTKE